MSLFSVFTLLGGLAFFIYGMNQIKNLHTNDDMQYERLYNIYREKYMGKG